MSESMGQPESPFLNVASFEVATDAVARRRGLTSPFVEGFAAEHHTPQYGNGDGDGARRLLLAELYDDELDETLYELVGEAAGLVSTGAGSLGLPALMARFEPLAGEVEHYVQRVADELGTRDVTGLTESDVDDVFARFTPERQLAPEFEQFFGGLKKAISKAAKGAVKLAKKGIQTAAALGLGPVLAKLKVLVRPLLERVLKAAINRLPVALQPAARTLAGKLPALFGSELDEGGADEAAADIGRIQLEFNEEVADVLLDRAPIGVQHEAGRWNPPDAHPETSIGDLDAARERFVAEIARLEQHEDPEPAVERFVPALLPALKLGLKLAGRKRVVSLLAQMISRLIARFVGPASSQSLSTALVDAGLKLIGLEVSSEDQRRCANAAVAATVEETVRRVSALPDAVLDNETLLEGAILEAFEHAAAANLPAVLPEAVYRRRPELAETDARSGTWLPLPIRGPKRYKKFSRVFRTRITPGLAMAVKTFGDAPMAQFLQEQLGLDPGEALEADLHLYEALPGTLVGEVAQLEANGHGSASTAEFHPLTREAAALLTREPGLGRNGTLANLSGPKDLAVGHRFYRLAVPGRRIARVGFAGSKGRPRRRTSLYTVVDFPGDRVRLFLFLSERKAQELAAPLRKQGHPGPIATQLKGFVERGLAGAIGGHIAGRVRILHEALAPAEARGAALSKIPPATLAAFAARVAEWTATALTDFLAAQSAKFVAATEDAQDGVTIIVSLLNPPGMAGLRAPLAGGAPQGAPPASGSPGTIQVDIVAGFTNG